MGRTGGQVDLVFVTMEFDGWRKRQRKILQSTMIPHTHAVVGKVFRAFVDEKAVDMFWFNL